MKVAVLPLNTTRETPAAWGRQFVNFACDTLKLTTGAEINAVSYLTHVEEDGVQRGAYVNVSDSMADPTWIRQLFEQAEVDWVADGMLERKSDGTFELKIRYTPKVGEGDPPIEEIVFGEDQLFATLHRLIKELADKAAVPLPESLAGETMEFGTDDPKVFLKFLEGYDGVLYVQQVQGQVAKEFTPQPAIQALLEACRADPDFMGPYESLVQLGRLCINHRIGTFDMIEPALVEATKIAPDDYRGYFVLAEGYQAVGDLAKASDFLEKALAIEPNEAALYTRLGIVQMMTNMPANAERNLRKALELEGDDKPSMDFLATVLQGSGRTHEVPRLWKDVLDKNPANTQAQAKYAISLLQAGREEDGFKAFEEALEASDDPTVIKRYYAPVLAKKGELDRAMDYFEDCLDVAPNDIPLLLEYASTLKEANRGFEIPKVLRDVLASNPDANTRAQTQAWLLEIEQEKRTGIVEAARAKMDAGDFQGAVKDLKPLRNWLADYWKMWALLSSAYNRLEQPEEAEDAARRLIDLFPGCEPGYGELIGALSAQGKDDEAYGIMRVATSTMPGSLPMHLNLALAAKRAGHPDEARDLAKRIREAIGPNEELEHVLAEIER